MNIDLAEERIALRDVAGRALRERAGGLSPFTAATYRRILLLFCDWHAAQYGAEADARGLAGEVVDRFLQWSAARCSPATVRLRRSALRWMAGALAHEEPGDEG